MGTYISKHFKREEFECKCGCGFCCVDTELIEVLEGIRTWFDKPIVITSGNRCFQHNANIGGARSSKHIAGIACDFKVIGIHEKNVVDYLFQNYRDKYGIGQYDGRTHLDIRPNMARWDSRIKAV